MFFHEHPWTVDEDLVVTFPMSAMIDLCGASTSLPMIAIRDRIPLFAFCFSPDHGTYLSKDCTMACAGKGGGGGLCITIVCGD